MLSVLAHAGQPPRPHDVWTAWNLDPVLVVGIAVVTLLYVRGRAGRPVPAARGRATAFAGGMVALAVALVSPLDAMSGALASAHMVQHVLLVLVAAPLLALAAPSPTLLRALPHPLVRAGVRAFHRAGGGPWVGRTLRQPAVVWVLHVTTLWFWHAAGPYGAALDSRGLHVAEHVSFLVTGLLLWRVLVGPRRATGTQGVGVLVVFGLAVQSVLLSALLTFAESPWYAGYTSTTAAWGLTPLDDQHLAGVIMWVPAGAIHVGVALTLLVGWITSSEPDQPAVARVS